MTAPVVIIVEVKSPPPPRDEEPGKRASAMRTLGKVVFLGTVLLVAGGVLLAPRTIDVEPGERR